MSTKLFIVEGLPGSGKSTAAEIVYELLKENDVDAELFSEGNNNHPADYEGFAYFEQKDYNLLLQSYPQSREVINEISIKYNNCFLIQYIKAAKEQKISFEDEIFDAISKNDIYELPLEQNEKLILERWNSFVDSYANKDKIAVFECCFIQNPVTVSMIRSNAAKAFTVDYVGKLADVIKPLEPVLIYIDQSDIRSSFNKSISERPKEWFEGFANYYTNQGYGLANGLKGSDGVLKVLEARNELEKEIYDSQKLIKYKIDNSLFDFDILKSELNHIISAHI